MEAADRSFPVRLVMAAINLYGAGVALYLLLRLLTGEYLWPVALANAFTPWLLMPGFLVLAAAVLLRDRLAAALGAIPALAFIWLYGGLLIPPAGVASAEQDTRLRVMVYNVAYHSADPDQLIDAVLSQQADIVGFNELGVGQAEFLDAALADTYPYRVFYPDGVRGKGLVSKYPIIEDSGPLSFNTFMTHQFTTIDVNGQSMRVLIAHPPRPVMRGGYYRYPDGVMADFERLIAEATTGAPTILMGDFNSTDQTTQYGLLIDAGLSDSFREVGWGLGLTYPERGLAAGSLDLPRAVRIDYIFHTDDFTALRAWVGPDGGSDHRPVLADLTLAQ